MRKKIYWTETYIPETKHKLVSDDKEVVGFEVNAEAAKYTNMFVSRHQTAGQKQYDNG
jgi:hypothetical protein